MKARLPIGVTATATSLVAYLAADPRGLSSARADQPVVSAATACGIASVVFRTSDREAARGFYAGLLGLEELPMAGGRLRFQVADGQTIEVVPGAAGSDGRLERIVFRARGLAPLARRRLTDPDGHQLELIGGGVSGPAPAGPDEARSRPLARARIAHVGVLAGSLGASLRFYRDRHGFVEFWRGGGNETRLDWVNLRVPGGEDYIELMLYDRLPAPAERGGKNHVCLFVRDVVAAAAAIEARPARKAYPRSLEVKVGRNRKRQLNLFDPDGTRVELMEPVTVDGKDPPSSTAPPPRP